jgi:PadR family transcriptional regulator, regulatory protein AphA
VSLKLALLGLLAERPMSGYELTKKFAGPSNVWTAQHGQIYPELARLKETGLIRQSEAGPRGRKTYTITASGLKQVRRWLVETEPDRTVRDESFLRVFFLWLLETKQARSYFEQEGARHRARLEQYMDIAAGPRPRTPAQRYDRIALEAGIRYEQAMSEWADWALSQVKRSSRQNSTNRA